MTTKQTLKKARALRQEAKENLEYKTFSHITRETEKYLSGEGQIPVDHTRDTYRDAGYFIVNFLPDLTDRITAMLAGGLDVHVRATDGSPSILERMCMALFKESQRQIHFPGVLFEWTHEGVAFNIGVARVYHDSSRLQRRGGWIGVETPHPLSIWISPYARDPYHPLLGSDYIGYETLFTREKLKADYPELSRRIAKLDKFQDAEVSSFDPVSSLTQSSGSVDDTVAGDDEWVPSGEDGGQPEDMAKDDERIRVTTVTYEDHEIVELEPGVTESIAVWKTFTVAGEVSRGKAIVVKEDAPVPYNLPNIVLFIYRRALSSSYGTGGAPASVFDLQDSFNAVYSQVLDQVQVDSVFKQVVFERAGALSNEDKNKLLKGSGPRLLTVDPAKEYMDDTPSDRLLWRFEDMDTDSGKNLRLLDTIISLMRLVPGVHSSVVGDVDVEKRLSGIALHATQQATLIAQEPARQHLNASARNLGKLLWEAIRYYWILPQTVALDDGTTVEVNTRVPVNEQTSELVDQLMQSPDPRGENGQPRVPTGLHLPSPDGDEIVIPLREKALVAAILKGETEYSIEGAEYSFNFLPLVELEIEMDVSGDAKERGDRQRAAMQWAATLPKGTFSWETIYNQVFEGDPHASPQLERQRLYGDEIAQIITQVQELGPEAQQTLTETIKNVILQIQQGQTQEPGQVSGPVPPTAQTQIAR